MILFHFTNNPLKEVSESDHCENESEWVAETDAEERSDYNGRFHPDTPQESTLGEMENEISKSRSSVHSLASSSSKASTVHPLVSETTENPSADFDEKPEFIAGLADLNVKLGDSFELSCKIENATEVVWTLENEEIEAEPEEGLLIKSKGKLIRCICEKNIAYNL